VLPTPKFYQTFIKKRNLFRYLFFVCRGYGKNEYAVEAGATSQQAKRKPLRFRKG
jgi:hypothetical protein